MATRTVVCPNCGAAAAPGRYACAECGSLLAAVGPAKRVRERAAPPRDVAPNGTPAEAASERAGAPDDVAADVESGSALEPEPVDDAMTGFDDNAPLAAARSAARRPEPTVLRDLVDDDHDESGSPAAAPPASAAPSWPPPGDLGTIVRPESRTPAGAYLPPSAVLPPLDVPVPSAPAEAARHGAPAPSFLDRLSAWLSGAVGSVDVSASGPRRAVLVGAAIVALGLLLPWVNTLPGSNPFANYLERWGLAGPGMWLVLAAAVILVMVAGSAGRPSTWALRVPAIGLAGFVIGLVWPYLLGGQGRAIGVWVVVVGALVLAVGGILERADRHGADEAGV
jgi:hypothetical protein